MIDDFRTKKAGSLDLKNKEEKEILAMKKLEHTTIKGVGFAVAGGSAEEFRKAVKGDKKKLMDGEKEGKWFEEKIMESIEECGGPLEAIESLVEDVKRRHENGNLSENYCKVSAAAFDKVFTELGTDEEKIKTAAEIIRPTYSEVPLWRKYLTMLTLFKNLIDLPFDAETLNGEEMDCLKVITESLLVLRSDDVSYKEIKAELNPHLNVERRKLLGSILRYFKGTMELNVSAYKAAEKVREILPEVGTPWTDERAMQEVVEFMMFATQKLLEDGYVENNLNAYKGDKVVVLPLRYRDNAEKKKVIDAAKVIVRQIQPDAISWAAETWYIDDKPGETLEERLGNLAPSEHPDRKEALLVQVQTPTGMWSAFQPFSRDENGKPVLGEIVGPRKDEQDKSEYLFHFDLGHSASAEVVH